MQPFLIFTDVYTAEKNTRTVRLRTCRPMRGAIAQTRNVPFERLILIV